MTDCGDPGKLKDDEANDAGGVMLKRSADSMVYDELWLLDVNGRVGIDLLSSKMAKLVLLDGGNGTFNDEGFKCLGSENNGSGILGSSLMFMSVETGWYRGGSMRGRLERSG